MPYFQDERVAIVQCRSVAVDSHEYSPMNRLLSRSINAFHVYFSVQSKFGWQPFIGHNAFLRTRAVQEVGGFTPGFFADDLDLTVRLNLKGITSRACPVRETGIPISSANNSVHESIFSATETIIGIRSQPPVGGNYGRMKST